MPRLAAALALALPLAARAAEPIEKTQLLAVLEFVSKLDPADRKAADPAYFANAVRAAAVDVPGIRVMTRENMLVMLRAQGKDLADCEGECEVDTGRRLAVDLVISGDLLKIGTSFKLDLRLHETQNGSLLAGGQASGTSVDDLDRAVPAAVNRLLSVLHRQSVPAAAMPIPSVAVARSAGWARGGATGGLILGGGAVALALGAEATRGEDIATVLGGAATVLIGVAVPIIYMAGSSARETGGVVGSPGSRAFAWVLYGLTMVDALVLLAVSQSATPPPMVITATGVLGAGAVGFMAYDAYQSANEAERGPALRVAFAF
jgi:hypothetical protein